MSETLVSRRSHLQIDWYGAGPTLLLLHGWGMNGAVWRDLAPALADMGFRVGTVDLPGFGDSPGQDLPQGGEALASLAEVVWSAFPDNEPVHLLGWSLGGLVATRMVLQAPSRTRSLVTLASSPCFQGSATWPGIAPAVLGQFRQQLAQDCDKTLSAFFALQAMGSATAREDVRRLKRAVMSKPKPDPEALDRGLGILQECDLRPQLAKLSGPWLRLYGRLDGLVPARVIEQVDSLAPGSVSVQIEKASHAPFISHPEETLAVLQRFYQGL
ncbi:pimeloyl-ACP methyl ester esterase BioH [Ferrimonas gelatinilytica]|uniref:Pimeloyl-[acyl-carrier protein] methyl ester esterase n=1 Tax=Ferrimonas gelatinilytica TaxID=1255257 RepID=A0ABP9SC03_9GAMM